jgi:hypothetical protein
VTTAITGGLLCDTLEALIRDKWEQTQINYCHDNDIWYLVGIEN